MNTQKMLNPGQPVYYYGTNKELQGARGYVLDRNLHHAPLLRWWVVFPNERDEFGDIRVEWCVAPDELMTEPEYRSMQRRQYV